MNQIVLGTLKEGRLCSIHRLDEETEALVSTACGLPSDDRLEGRQAVERQGWPVKYWPDGPDGWHESGWYFYNSDGQIEGTFSVHPFDGEPFDHPLITAYDPNYKSVILLVLVADYRVSEPEFAVEVKPVRLEQLKDWLTEF